jgi:MoaA/NifB/PqqE/SkfB family radical SAM enzyme
MYNGPIKKMHLEITNRCNAACPACPRTGDFKGKLAGHMAMSGWHDLTLSDIKEIHKEVPTLKEVNLCGNFGDPAAAPDFFKIVNYFADNNIRVIISTNGGPRTPKAWASIARLGVKAQFHIDGDEDTNHIYRVGTKWNKIMANAQAYLDAGGSANWTLIPFKHNEHTIDKCEELANKMGFSQFKVKKTYRVGNNDSTSQPIELPTNKKYINEYVHKNINRDINCKARNEDEIYISADGDVAPCCWTGSNLWQEKYKNPKSPKSPSVENNYFVDFDNNFRTNKLSNIIDSYIDKTDQYEVAWECKAFAVCNKSCGTSKWLDRYQDRS